MTFLIPTVEQARAGLRAMKTVLGTTPQEFTADWRDYLKAQLA